MDLISRIVGFLAIAGFVIAVLYTHRWWGWYKCPRKICGSRNTVYLEKKSTYSQNSCDKYFHCLTCQTTYWWDTSDKTENWKPVPNVTYAELTKPEDN